MSYDLRLWTVDPVPQRVIKELMPDARISDSGVEFAANGWLATIGSSTRVEAEDIPDNVAATVHEIAWLTEVTIQPISASEDAKVAIKEALRRLARDFNGVVEDPQADVLVMPSGPQPSPVAPTDDRVSTLNLNYWFAESPLRTKEGRRLLVDYLARHLPAALPRRYGLYEPPSENWKSGGEKAFLDFLDRRNPDDEIVVYPTRPCVSFHLSLASVGWVSRGRNRIFKCGCLQLCFEFTSLEDAEWRTALGTAWLEIARIAEAFATNVEVVDDWIIRRGRLWSDRQTGGSVCSSAWFGVPRRLGLAFGLGESYVDCWPQLRAHALWTGGLAFVDTGDWRSRRSVSEIVGDAPEAIRERPGRGRTVGSNGVIRYSPVPDGYPDVFFFPMPHRPWATFAGSLHALFKGR